MKTLIKIGFNWFLLPDSANVGRLLKEMSAAVCMREHYGEGYYFTPEEREGRCDIEVKIVKNDQIRDRPKLKQIPETTGGPY